jgi:transposase
VENVITIGADVHDKNIAIRKAVRDGDSIKETVRNRPSDIYHMVKRLWAWAHKEGCNKIIVVYEASGSGYGFHDILTEKGIDCRILAPTKIAFSVKDRKMKTDDRDAVRLLQVLRNSIFAGDKLPSIWIPSDEVRDDRELVRASLDLRNKATAVKTQIQCLLKRNRLRKPENMKDNWTKKHIDWISTTCVSNLSNGTAVILTSLMRQYLSLEEEIKFLKQEIKKLSRTERYAAAVCALENIQGIGTMSAMVFLTEIGDLNRFDNRRQIGSYFGLAPSSHESGDKNDRKGHITYAGSSRMRKCLCQAIWCRVRKSGYDKFEYDHLRKGSKKRNGLAIVALMRKLSIKMWHKASDAMAENKIKVAA